MKNLLLGAVLAFLLAAVLGGLAVQSGLPDFAADQPHGDYTFRLIDWARERSVALRSASVTVPADLKDPERVRRGAGNYDAMCVGCHLSPASGDSEIRLGLYPQPPDLAKPAGADSDAAADARRFWIIKHGIKGSAMAAWGRGGMGDAAIWDLVAFVKALPALSAVQYGQAVAASDGHVHGPGDAASVDAPPQPSAGATRAHTHADGHGNHEH